MAWKARPTLLIATPKSESKILMKIDLNVRASGLEWKQSGSDWILYHGRRRMGRVVPDAKYRCMCRSVKSRGRLSDTSNLSWAKNVVLIAAERELEWEARDIAAIDPRKCP